MRRFVKPPRPCTIMQSRWFVPGVPVEQSHQDDSLAGRVRILSATLWGNGQLPMPCRQTLGRCMAIGPLVARTCWDGMGYAMAHKQSKSE